jgi:hypothetical protein
VAVASSDGTVARSTPRRPRLWRASAAARIAAGVGSDGKLAAVVTRATNSWRFARQGAVAPEAAGRRYTAPFVAGGRSSC